MKTLNLFRYIGLRHLKEKKVRAFFTILGVASGIALFTAIDLINRATLTSFKENFKAVAGTANLTVNAGDSGFPENKLAVVEKIKGVKRAVPMIEENVYFTSAKGTETLVVFGIDMLKEQAVRNYKTVEGNNLMDDPLVFLNQPDSLIVSSIFAEAHHLKIDSKIRLATAHGGKDFTVRGILSPEGAAKAYGGSMALMDIDGARVTFGKLDKMDRVDIVAAEGEDIEALAARCKEALGAGYQVEKPDGQAESMSRMVSSYQKLLSLLSFLAMLVGLFMITNSMGMAVTERRKEIGVLRALGATRGGILAVFLTEAAAMGAAGAMIGGEIGWFGSRFLVNMISNSMSTQYMMQFSVPVIEWQFNDMVRATIIGLVASLIAAAWPSIKATRVQPIEAIRNQSDQTVGSVPKTYLFLAIFFLGFLQISSSLEWNDKFLWVELLNQTSSILGAILITPWVVLGFVKCLAFLSKKFSIATRLSQENLVKDPIRISSNVLMLMTGLILMVMVSTVNSSFRNSIDAWLGKVLRSDLLVASPGQIYAYKTQPLHQDLKQELEKIPGLRDSLQYPISGMRFMHFKYENKNLVIKAFDKPEPNNMSIFDVHDRDPVEAAQLLFGSKLSVLVSKNFSTRFKKKTGDEMQIQTPSGPANALIVGVVTDFASNEGVIYLDRAKYSALWKDPLVTVFYLKAKDGADLEAIRKNIDSRYGQSKNLVVRLNSELRQDLAQNIDRNFAYAKAIEGAALFIALLGLLNALYVSVMERTRELGLLHAIGMTRAQIIQMVVLESLSQGLVAAVLAVSLGSWMSYLWIKHSLENVLGWRVQFYFPTESIFIACALGLLVALLAGLFPARRAAHLEIKEALNYE